MGTVLDGITTEEQRSFVSFFERKNSIKGYSERNVSRLRWEVFVAANSEESTQFNFSAHKLISWKAGVPKLDSVLSCSMLPSTSL
jgi:hypothetical protein